LEVIAVGAIGCPRKCPISMPSANSGALLCPERGYDFYFYQGFRSKPLKPASGRKTMVRVVDYYGSDSEHGKIEMPSNATDAKGFVTGKVTFSDESIGVYRLKAEFVDGSVRASAYTRPLRVTKDCGPKPKVRNRSELPL
jgi:hypothetical protein